MDIGSGDREPVVFVHGLGGQWQNWLENIPRLAQDRRVSRSTCPASGSRRSPRDERSRSPATAAAVNALCDRLGLGKVDLVGNSMGGFIAAEVAIQFPERVDAAGAGLRRRHLERRDARQTPILTFGRVAAALAANSAARYRQLAARPVTRHAVARAGGAPPAAA